MKFLLLSIIVLSMTLQLRVKPWRPREIEGAARRVAPGQTGPQVSGVFAGNGGTCFDAGADDHDASTIITLRFMPLGRRRVFYAVVAVRQATQA